MAVGGHFEDSICRQKKTNQKNQNHITNVHVILDVYALLLLDHADPKFNISEKFPLSNFVIAKINFTDFKIFVLSPFKKCKTAIHTIHLSTPSFI